MPEDPRPVGADAGATTVVEPDRHATDAPWYRRPRTLLLAALAAVGGVLALLGIAFLWIYATADIPPPDQLAVPDPTVVYDASGEEVATLEPTAIGRNVSVDELPRHVPEAVLAAEDRDFHEHGGFSATAIARAAWANVTSGEVVQGASTIHQQYVELAVTEVDATIPGKFREVAFAAKLDDELPKERVLEMYLNAVPFGRGAQGIDSAAMTYFRVPAADLDLNQAATLAGIIAAPSAYDPERNPDDATSRRDYVLRGMAAEGWIDGQTAEATIASPLPEVATDPLVQHGNAAYFLDAVRDVVPDLLGETSRDPATNLAIHTTLDPRLQGEAIEAVTENLADSGHSGSVVTLDADTGAVRALVGGLDYETQEFNVAVEGRRQAGSAFKPFALTAFVDQGGSPASTVRAPRTVSVPDGGGGEAQIGNYTQRGYGQVTVREATQRSINTAYMNIAEEVGYDGVVEMAHRLGIESELPEVPTSVLGVGGVTPLEMASAYGTLAAQGTRHPTHFVTRIETLDGQLLWEHEPEPEEVLDPNVAAVVTDVLQDVVTQGTGTAAALDRPVAGKTGTTNDYKDAWFVGYTPGFVTAVWVGNLDNTPMPDVTGGSLPAVTWGAYMQEVVAPAEPLPFPEPDLAGLDTRHVGDRPPATEEPSPAPPEPEPTVAPSPEPPPTREPETEEPTQHPTEPTEQPSEEPPPPSEEPPPPSEEPPPPSEEPTEDSTRDPSAEPTDDPSPTEDASPSEEPSGEPSPSEDDGSSAGA